MSTKVKNQFEYAIGLKEVSSKFVALWTSFNCYYNTQKFSGRNYDDRTSVNKLKQDNACKDVFEKLQIDVFYNFISERITSNGNEGGVDNLKDLNEVQNVRYTNKEIFGEYLEIIYTIRSNQIHGSKNPKDDRDNKLLEQATQSFENFLRNLYETDGIID